MKLVFLLSLLASAAAFTSIPASRVSTQMKAIDQTQVGVLRPVGLFDPLNLMEDTAAFERRRISEIKHGRVAMVAVIGNLAPQIGFTFPGYLSTSSNVKFSDVSSEGSFAALTKIPPFGVFQILMFAAIMELWTWKQEKGMAPGDVGGRDWVRYQDEVSVGLGWFGRRAGAKRQLVLYSNISSFSRFAPRSSHAGHQDVKA